MALTPHVVQEGVIVPASLKIQLDQALLHIIVQRGQLSAICVGPLIILTPSLGAPFPHLHDFVLPICAEHHILHCTNSVQASQLALYDDDLSSE